MIIHNPGLAFNKTVFTELNPLDKSAYKNATKELHQALFTLPLNPASAALLDASTFVEGDSRTFIQENLTVSWPGLLIGLGYSHGTKTGADNRSHPLETEMKNGFFFDFATGLPVLPGPTVKGILRSYFPGRYKSKNSLELKSAVNKRISEILKTLFPDKSYCNYIDKLEEAIFEGKNGKDNNGNEKTLSSTEQDIFFDAFPCAGVRHAQAFIKNPPENAPDAFLGEEVITPHHHPLKDPVPLKLLKILPGVKMKFQFLLNDVGMPAADKKELFMFLLTEFGVGAKKGVGFGQLTSDTPIANQLTDPGYIEFDKLNTEGWETEESDINHGSDTVKGIGHNRIQPIAHVLLDTLDEHWPHIDDIILKKTVFKAKVIAVDGNNITIQPFVKGILEGKTYKISVGRFDDNPYKIDTVVDVQLASKEKKGNTLEINLRFPKG